MLCLSLAGLAPMPLSACAMWMAAPANCALANDSAESSSQCESAMDMAGMGQDSIQAGASKLPCCELVAAPLPDASAGISIVKVTPAVPSEVSSQQMISIKLFEQAAAVSDVKQFATPPDTQPLLCTFLI